VSEPSDSELSGNRGRRWPRRVAFATGGLLALTTGLFTLGLLWPLRGLTPPPPNDHPLALVGISVVDVEAGALMANQTVLVARGRIVASGDAASVGEWIEDRQRMLDEHDPVMAQEIFAAMRRNGTWFVPTHLTRWEACQNERQACRQWRSTEAGRLCRPPRSFASMTGKGVSRRDDDERA
jgi:hypothetical protein